ncbi:MAG: tail fiber domain-containing protein [bacterium]
MKRHTFKTAGAVFLLAAVLCAPATADRMEVATANVTGGSLHWDVHVGYDGLELTVAGEGRHVARTFESGETPSFSLFDDEGEPLPDGTYTWELVVSPKLTELDPEEFENLRSSVDGAEVRDARAPERQVASGAFTVRGGQVVDPNLSEGPEAGEAEQKNTLATKDQVISDDLIVLGSECVGIDCVNGENFGFDTIRLKENNLRIKFEDTSVESGSFPTNDWELVANDSASGGLSHFSIRDVDAARRVFTVEADAPSNSLYVESSGDVGFGTSNPVVDLHVKDGDSPTLRLEQDGSSGFAPQTFDVAGNEANFFVRDASNGSTLPFRIRPGAPTSSIDIAASGNVGVGTGSPEAKLHVENGSVLVQNSSNPGFNLEDDDGAGASSWTFELNGNGLFQMNKAGSGGPEILVRERADGTGGQETLDVDGSIEADNFNVSSSRTFKTGFEPVDRNEILAQVLDLPIQEWSFKWDKRGSRHIGPMAEDFLDLFGVGSTDSISILDATGIAMAAIQGLHEVVEDRDRELRELREEVADLREMLKDLSVSGDSQ